ncbi:MAG TPA: flavin reductase family protein [Planctomycetes bacterium]|nr:flavin reductase family protein [Planctomycetota bacterium]
MCGEVVALNFGNNREVQSMQVESTFERARALKYPEQIVIAIARDPAGKYNPITLGWVTQTSHEPPMFAISIGNTRYSLGVIRAAKEFVLAWPSEHQKDETLFFGTKSGREVDKLAEAGTPTQPARAIDGVLLRDAVANLECRLVSELQTGDHVIFVGQVVAAHVNRRPLNRLYTVGENYQFEGLPRR